MGSADSSRTHHALGGHLAAIGLAIEHHGEQRDRRRRHDHVGRAEVVLGPVNQPGGDQRRQATDDAGGYIEAKREG